MNRPLTEAQIACLRSALSASDHRIGLRVSYAVNATGLLARGLIEKRGRKIHRTYWITQAGRDALANHDGGQR